MLFTAIIVAAGSGRRMGFDKLMAPLNGKPVLQHSVETFLKIAGLEKLILVTDKQRFQSVTSTITDDRLIRVNGGKERHDSVAAGLARISRSSDLIAVHDGARPLIHSEQIKACLEAAQSYRAASSAHRITDTLKRSNDRQQAQSSVSRDNLWAMETPQIFERSLLMNAYERLITNQDELVTDEVSAVEKIGMQTYLVENNRPNPKITFPQDLALAEHLARISHLI